MDIKTALKNQLRTNIPKLKPGQVIRVYETITEGDKERIQVFEGLVMAVRHNLGLDGTFVVRKIGVNQVVVERIFPLHLPSIKKIEILRQEKVRRAKLNYIRKQVGKKTRKRGADLKDSVYEFVAGTQDANTPKDIGALEGLVDNTAEQAGSEEGKATSSE